MSPRGKKQPSLPGEGMESENIPDLEEAADKYRDLVTKRMALQKDEEQAKADLIGEIHKQIQGGHLKQPPESDSSLVAIYRYQDDDGVERMIKWGRKEAVKVNKAKDTDADAEAL